MRISEPFDQENDVEPEKPECVLRTLFWQKLVQRIWNFAKTMRDQWTLPESFFCVNVLGVRQPFEEERTRQAM